MLLLIFIMLYYVIASPFIARNEYTLQLIISLNVKLAIKEKLPLL